MSETNNTLSALLSTLHQTDVGIFNKIKDSFANNHIAIGNGSKLVSSDYTISNATTSSDFGTANTVATETGAKAYIDGVSAYLNAEIENVVAEDDSLTGITAIGALSASTKADRSQTVTVNVDGKTVLVDSGKLKTGITLSSIGGDTTHASRYALVDSTGQKIGDTTIDIHKDQFLSGAVYEAATESLKLTFFTASGTTTEVSVPMAGLAHEYEDGNGIHINEVTDGNSTIAIQLDNSSVDGNNYLTLTSNGLGLSGITAAIETASGNVTNFATAGLETLSAAVSGYLSANAVTNKFSEIDSALNAAGLGTSFTPGKVLAGDEQGHIAASDYSISNATASADFGTADTIATETGAKAYVDGVSGILSSAIADKLSGAVGNLVAEQFVVAKSKNSVKTTGLSSVTVITADATDTQIPTAKAVVDYVTAGLEELYTSISAFNANELGILE